MNHTPTQKKQINLLKKNFYKKSKIIATSIDIENTMSEFSIFQGIVQFKYFF